MGKFIHWVRSDDGQCGAFADGAPYDKLSMYSMSTIPVLPNLTHTSTNSREESLPASSR